MGEQECKRDTTLSSTHLYLHLEGLNDLKWLWKALRGERGGIWDFFEVLE